MIDLIRKERQVRTEYGKYRLAYQIHKIREEEIDIYGISISQYRDTKTGSNLCDEAMISGFSENLAETESFFDILIRENVFPVHLFSLADDWHS